jgi:hypothetical protein
MTDRNQMRQLSQVVRLRDVQSRAAAAAVRESTVGRDLAERSRDACDVSCQEALGIWFRLLGESRPSPALVAMGANWLLAEEQRAREEELNLSIAERRLQQTRDEYARSLANEAAAKKTSAQVRTAMEKSLEERQSLDQADALLWRRYR